MKNHCDTCAKGDWGGDYELSRAVESLLAELTENHRKITLKLDGTAFEENRSLHLRRMEYRKGIDICRDYLADFITIDGLCMQFMLNNLGGHIETLEPCLPAYLRNVSLYDEEED